jgi:putative transposase
VDTVDAPLGRWGSQTGVRGVWGSWVEGRKVFLTLSTTKRESEESGLAVVRERSQRGRQTPGTSTTDGAPGRIKALDAMGPKALRRRCWFHKRQNVAQKVPPQAWPAFKALVAARRDAPTFEEGHRRCERLVAEYQGTFPEACRCLADDTEASLNHLKVPLRHRQYVRTSNLAERACEEERRRTKVLPHLWDAASLVKLVCAVLIRVSERWGKKQYSAFEQHQMRALRHTLGLDQPPEAPSLVTMAPQPRRSAASAR